MRVRFVGSVSSVLSPSFDVAEPRYRTRLSRPSCEPYQASETSSPDQPFLERRIFAVNPLPPTGLGRVSQVFSRPASRAHVLVSGFKEITK